MVRGVVCLGTHCPLSSVTSSDLAEVIDGKIDNCVIPYDSGAGESLSEMLMSHFGLGGSEALSMVLFGGKSDQSVSYIPLPLL